MPKLIGPHIKAVVLDWDDNLVATFEAKSRQHQHVARTHYQKELSSEEIHEHWGKPLDTLIRAFYETDDVEQAVEFILACHADFPKELFPETKKILADLKSAELAVGLVTATSRRSLDIDIGPMGVKDYFDYTQTQESTSHHKPDPKVFDPTKEWLQTLGISSEEAIYLGDGLHDMHAAVGAGFEFIGTGRGLVTPAEFESHGVRAIPHIGHLL